MKNIGLFILGSLLIPILKIIYLFFKFKFSHLHTTRIGHQTINFDAALLSVKKDTLIFFSYDKKIANEFIFSFLKKQKNIFFIKIFKYIFFSIDHVNPNSNLIISEKDYQPKFTYHLKYRSRIEMPFYSKDKINEILLEYKMNQKYVGLYSRNNKYLKKYVTNDKNFHDYRDFNFEDYSLAIKYLNNHNNSVVKLGETFLDEETESYEGKIFTSLDFNNDKEMDYFINVHSRYNVFCNTGASGLSEVLRKKTVYVNLIPFSWHKLSYCAPESILLPKKIFDLEKKRFLSFREILAVDVDIHNVSDPFLMQNLKYINNTPEEILNAIVEMEERLSGNQKKEKFIKFNDLFWDSLNKNNEKKVNHLKNQLKLSISTQFLEDNQDLL
ncbi:TIGR04372 family glycosyltransferase [Candidatus Pelagibacter sp.]|nr:TIGR04372 family glycosyltransferase [Candidatus Pelagibacter sp.]